MDKGPTQETWHHLRQEARKAAEARWQSADDLTREALEGDDLVLLEQMEQRLGRLNEIWAVHQRPLSSRLPLVGPLLNWLGARLARFLLQRQVDYNAEIARVLQELYQVQQRLARAQLERTDDLFFRLEENVLALEARLKDLEGEVERLRRPS